MDQKIRCSLAGRFWLSFWWFSVKLLTSPAALIWRHDWGWRICFYGGPFTWLLLQGLSSFIGLFESPHSMSGGFTQSRWCKREQRGNHMPFVICSILNTHTATSAISYFYKWVTKSSPLKGRQLSSTFLGVGWEEVFCQFVEIF